MKKRIPTFKTDKEAEDFVATAGLTSSRQLCSSLMISGGK
jgi:hypothetical protein